MLRVYERAVECANVAEKTKTDMEWAKAQGLAAIAQAGPRSPRTARGDAGVFVAWKPSLCSIAPNRQVIPHRTP